MTRCKRARHKFVIQKKRNAPISRSRQSIGTRLPLVGLGRDKLWYNDARFSFTFDVFAVFCITYAACCVYIVCKNTFIHDYMVLVY